MEVRPALQAHLPAAVQVWQAANVARGVVPSPQRADRIRQKLEAAEAIVLLGWVDPEVRAMVLAEPWRTDAGAGSVVPGRGHVSMVFVNPGYWSQGLGTALLAGLHASLEQLGWFRTTLWTRESNNRAQRLYLGSGYRPTGRTADLAAGERILELDRSPIPSQHRAQRVPQEGRPPE
ncbi:GNAT family N-acetyltransferase [uncultured Friedmanniella sp.]|uniref:GNAT family N-acetyltransferase n=1 Tax=uncultured Friedmanniella sp. TaxID=335381 RepID=UPI0035CA3EF2